MLTFTTDATEKWRLLELDAIVDDFDDDLFNTIEAQCIKTEKNYQNIIAYAAAKSTITFREIILLFSFGYPDGAFSLARNLYEQFVVMCFFKIKKGDADFSNYIHDYFIDFDLKQYKVLKYECEQLEGDETELKKYAGKIEQLKKAATISGTKGDYWWSGYNSFKELSDFVLSMCDEINKAICSILQARYKLACISLHSSCLGNTFRLGSKRGFAGVDTSPTLECHAVPLEFAIASFIMVVAESCEEFGICYSCHHQRAEN